MPDESIQIKQELEAFKAALNVKQFRAIDDGIGIGRVEVEALIPESVKTRFSKSNELIADHDLKNEMELYRPQTQKQVWKPLSSAIGATDYSSVKVSSPGAKQDQSQISSHMKLSFWTRLLVFSLDFSLVTLTSLVGIISYRLFGDHNERFMLIVKLPLEALNVSPSLTAPILMLGISSLVYLMYKLCLKIVKGRTLGENILTRLLEQ